jgi:hypothetical protein
LSVDPFPRDRIQFFIVTVVATDVHVLACRTLFARDGVALIVLLWILSRRTVPAFAPWAHGHQPVCTGNAVTIVRFWRRATSTGVDEEFKLPGWALLFSLALRLGVIFGIEELWDKVSPSISTWEFQGPFPDGVLATGAAFHVLWKQVSPAVLLSSILRGHGALKGVSMPPVRSMGTPLGFFGTERKV